MKPILNDRAMFADATEEYRSPEEPSAGDTVKLKFRTAKYNVDRVEVVVNGIAYSMKKFMTNTNFDYYIAEFTLGAQRTEYYFHALVGRTSIYYNQAGPYRELNPTYNFVINPGFKTPDWAKGAVIYQIYVDRFHNGDKSNDVVDNEYVYIGEPVHRITDWNEYPATMDVRNFYGGDLQGVLDKMDYLESLGIDAIYFNPLFVSPSNHKYDIQDYDYIDPHFGVIVNDGGEPLPDNARSNDNATKYKKRVTDYANLEASNEFFAKLVEEAHRRNIKVIIDGVFNHCGSFNKWLDRERIYEGSEGFDKGAYVDKESPYHDFSSSRMTMHGHTISHTLAGGDTILFRSSIMRVLRSLKIISLELQRNGFPLRTMWMAGDLMSLLTLVFRRNTTIFSGASSGMR